MNEGVGFSRGDRYQNARPMSGTDFRSRAKFQPNLSAVSEEMRFEQADIMGEIKT